MGRDLPIRARSFAARTLGFPLLFLLLATPLPAADNKPPRHNLSRATGSRLVRDVNLNTKDATPGSFVELGGYCYFAANDGVSGIELWRTDGTAAGTTMVKDISPGAASSGPDLLTIFRGEIFFAAGDGASYGLWKSNGTAAGTVKVADFYTGSGTGVQEVLVVGSGLYIAGPDTSGIGPVVWYSDGTTAGTMMVGGRFVSGMTAFGGKVYFAAGDLTANGRELWVTNGTAVGTVEVADIWAGSNGSNPGDFRAVGGTLYFRARDGSSNYELWKSDGTAAGTVLVKEIRPGTTGSYPIQLIDFGGTLFFFADDGANYYSLWQSDGTDTGTVKVGGAFSNTQVPRYSTVINTTLFFAATNGTNGYELWKSDGTGAGTVLVKDINPGIASANCMLLTDVGGVLYFAANDGTTGNELWRSDGTVAGTVLVTDINTGGNADPLELANAGGVLYFSATTPSFGREIWKSDGSVAGTAMVRDINVLTQAATMVSPVNANGRIFCGLSDGVNSQQLWVSDGTASGTRRVGPLLDYVNYLFNVSGIVYFTGADATYGAELWRSDGTDAGTFMVKDFFAGSFGSNAAAIAAINGMIFVVAQGDINSGLWRTDGTDAGTVFLKTLDSIRYPTVMNGVLYFAGRESATAGIELYRSDGTAAGTRMVKDIYPGLNNSSPNRLAYVGGALYFQAGSPGSVGVWKSDGSDAGTVFVDFSSNARSFTEHGGAVLFVAEAAFPNVDLWRTDGTAAGTALVSRYSTSNPVMSLVKSGSVFLNPPSTVGTELFVTDGTAGGTVLVKDICNPGSAGVDKLTDVDGVIYFTATDGSSGTEMWRSNGSAEGTVQVADIFPGATSSSPTDLLSYNGVLFCMAKDFSSDIEPRLVGELPRVQGVLGSQAFSTANGLAISISDPDAGSNPLLVTLSVGQGTVTLAGTAGLTFVSGDGTDDATMSFTGTLPDINAALDGLLYVSTTGYVGKDALRLVTNDQRTADPGGAWSATDEIPLVVVPSGPNMAVTGNNLPIVSGDSTPVLQDHTHFGNAAVVGGTLVRTFTVGNTGNAGLALNGTPAVQVTGANPADFTVQTMPTTPVLPGGSTTFSVVFDPTTTGLRQASIVIPNDDPAKNPYTFAVAGYGGVPEIDVQGLGQSIAAGSLTPSSTDGTDFGSVSFAAGVGVRTFTIRNTATDQLLLTGAPSVRVSGATEFTVTTQPAATVAGGGSTTFAITFRPTTIGRRSAVVSIPNTDVDESPYTFAITGYGSNEGRGVINGNMEVGAGGNALGWWRIGPAAASWATDAAHSGTRSLKLVSTGGDSVWVGTPVALPEPWPYTLSVGGWSKATNVAGTVAAYTLQFTVTFDDMTTATYSAGLGFAPGTHLWQQAQRTVTFPKRVRQVQPFCRLAGGNGVQTVWFDDVWFAPLRTVSRNFAADDGTLPTGAAPADWFTFGTGGTWATDQKHSGQRSLKLATTGNNAGWWNAPFTFGEPYPQRLTVRGWARADALATDARLALQIYVVYDDNSTAWLLDGLRFANGTHDWQEVVKQFSLPKGVKQVRTYCLLYGGSGAQTAWFDDVEVIPGEPRNLNYRAELGAVGGGVRDWTTGGQYLSRFSGWATDEKHSGARSLKTVNGSGSAAFWAGAPAVFSQPYPTCLVLGGWSKATNVAATAAAYRLSYHLVLADNSTVMYAPPALAFTTGTHAWEMREVITPFPQGVKQVTAFCLLYGGTGLQTAWFDDVYAIRYEPVNRNDHVEQGDPAMGPALWSTAGQSLTRVTGWATDAALSGSHSLKIVNNTGSTALWSTLKVGFGAPYPRGFTVVAASQANAVATSALYGLVLNVEFADGSTSSYFGDHDPATGRYTLGFAPGTHGWQSLQRRVLFTKDVKSIVPVCLLYRGTGTQTAWFDDVYLIPE